MDDENDVILVSLTTWEWLTAMLEAEPRVLPRLRALMQEDDPFE